MQGELAQLKAPSRVLLTASSLHSTLSSAACLRPPPPHTYTHREAPCVSPVLSESAPQGSCRSSPGAAWVRTDSREAMWHVHKEEYYCPGGGLERLTWLYRSRQNAIFPGHHLKTPLLTCSLPPDWSRQHSWGSQRYFSGSTLFIPSSVHHAPSAYYVPDS